MAIKWRKKPLKYYPDDRLYGYVFHLGCHRSDSSFDGLSLSFRDFIACWGVIEGLSCWHKIGSGECLTDFWHILTRPQKEKLTLFFEKELADQSGVAK